MQTLRKKSSPLKYKNETTRFLGDGVSFKAKLIGILEVSEARGDRMCQEALSDLKMAIRAAGEHKQRITINIAIDGLRLRDEKTGDSLYHHPVHKISFIAQDMTDSRAFGYIFGSPDTGHRFFGIKTDKAASQVVIAMRDLFQVVFALKKKEIELAKQHLEKTCYPSSPLFSDSSSSSSKLQSVPNVSIKSAAEAKSGHAGDLKSSGTAVADLVDLELELNSLQQGLNQMERITPSDPFGTKDDPFGDSFISYPMRPILPPPPSSGKERSSRTSDSSIVFSPKTPHTNISVDASDKKKEFSFTQESNSGDWFTPSIASSIFEEPSSLPDPPKDDKHEQTKQEILSQFDVFTELDPLGTGRSKPYIDRKHFFQELKNPPKKALNDLVVTTNTTPEPSLSHHRNAEKAPPPQSTQATAAAAVFTLDPFGEDPFVTEDPFADSDFSKQDPFAAEFGAAFPVHLADDAKKDELQSFVHNSLCKSPRALEKQISLSVSPKAATSFARPTTTFDVLSSRENPSFDASSEGECAPEPPPRPPSNVLYIKPPPLPPKKQSNDMSVKPPPPRPHYVPPAYDFLDKYESVVEQVKSPPLPVPARKARFDAAPERPRKHFGSSLSEEDYLTPISLPEKGAAAVLLPPPQKTSRKVSEPATKTNAAASLESTCDGLDITLSQLTLSGLNELARKLHIPPGQLSNMTLVQLTSYLSNYIKSSSNGSAGTATVQPNAEATDTFAPFHADFASNFSNCTTSDAASTYDRYAVFRELMEEEIKQTKIDGEPEELLEKQTNDDAGAKPSSPDEVAIANSGTDKYAALREIVERELKHSELSKEIDDIAEEEEEEPAELQVVVNGDKEIDVIVKEDSLNNNNGGEVQEKEVEYVIEKETEVVAVKLSTVVVKSPVPSAVTDIVQNSARLTSGSLSDVVSGSSPEIDNTASNSDVGKKAADAAGESWAIFDQATIPLESVDEKQAIQSEEGVSPWSSDSKEFGNGSPPGWRRSKDSGSGAEQYVKKRRDHDGWWDTSADPEVNYCASNRRSTDSYDEEYYECYDRPRRRKQQTGSWQHGGKGSTAAGHSSSSRDVSPWEEEQQQQQSRRRELREVRAAYRHARGPSFERHRDRRLTDSWDEEDDYEYDEDHPARIHRSGRHSARDADLDSRHNVVGRDHESSDRWCEDRGEERRHRRRRDARDRWCCPEWEQTENEKPPRYGGGSGGSRWTTTTSSSAEAGVVKWRERYYSRESQESPWEDEYANEAEASPHFVTKRNWKRPSSASEMDRKTGEIKSRHHLGTGGSDGERADRRYKSGRRSRSRDSHYSEPSHRHKQDAGPSLRNVYRTKPHSHPKSVDGDFSDTKKPLEVKLEKKMSSMSRKKPKDSPKGEENIVVGTLPRKSPGGRGKLLFENDFVSTSESPASAGRGAAARFNFDNDFETSEAESPVSLRPVKTLRQQTMFEKNSPPVDRERQRGGSLRESPRYQKKARSHFEDDFSPVGVDRAEPQPQLLPEDGTISSIKEEVGNEDDDEFGASNFEKAVSGRMKILSKNRLSAALRSDVMKKSESVNIFARDDDPFDDEFFCGEELDRDQKRSPRSCELRWTEDFEN